jgi:hypothetical protein
MMRAWRYPDVADFYSRSLFGHQSALPMTEGGHHPWPP